jgi:hypothetical protein
MKVLKSLFVLVALVVVQTTFAQKVKVLSGSADFLKTEKELNVVYNYDALTVGKKSLPEKQYIADTKADKEKGEKGNGEKWEAAWQGQKKERFEPKFEELFNKYTDNRFTLIHGATAKYTLTVKTTNIEPGFKIGMSTIPAKIDAVFTFTEQATGKVVYEVEMLNAPGADAMGFDFAGGTRIMEGYAKSGKELGQLVSKSLKK